MGEWMYNSMHSLPRHQIKVSGQLHAPAALTPQKEYPVPIEQKAGWVPEPVWMRWRRTVFRFYPYGIVPGLIKHHTYPYMKV